MSAGPHPTEDRLIDLAGQLLSLPIEDDTLRHLESCGPCEERFRSICRDAELASLRAPIPRRVPRWRLAAAAASLLLAAISIAAWTSWTGRADAAAYWFPVDLETVGLRAGTPSGDGRIFHEAVEAYRRHDPARVVTLLRDRSIPEALDPLKIMLASALVKTGESKRAEDVLTELRIETLPQPDRDRASWILYAALDKGGKRAEALALAEALAARTGEFSEGAKRAVACLRQSDQ